MSIRTIRFSDQAEAALAEMVAATEGSEAEVIHGALSAYWWMCRALGAGGQLLIRRGDVITELLVPGFGVPLVPAPPSEEG